MGSSFTSPSMTSTYAPAYRRRNSSSVRGGGAGGLGGFGAAGGAAVTVFIVASGSPHFTTHAIFIAIPLRPRERLGRLRSYKPYVTSPQEFPNARFAGHGPRAAPLALRHQEVR